MDTRTSYTRADIEADERLIAEMVADPELAAIGHEVDAAFEQGTQRQEPVNIGTAAVLDASRGGNFSASHEIAELSQEEKIARAGYRIVELRELMGLDKFSSN